MSKMELYKNMNCYDEWRMLTNRLNRLRSSINMMVIMANNSTDRTHSVNRQQQLEIEHDKLIDNIFSTKPYWLANEITSNLLEWKYIN